MTAEEALKVHKQIARFVLIKLYPSAIALKQEVDPDEYLAIIVSWLGEHAFSTYDEKQGEYHGYCYRVAERKHVDLNRFFLRQKRAYKRHVPNASQSGPFSIDHVSWRVQAKDREIMDRDEVRVFLDTLRFDLRAALNAFANGDRKVLTPVLRRRLQEHREAHPVDLQALGALLLG